MKLDIGKQKQPWAYEVVGLSLIAPFQERILSPFFVTRSVGVLLSGPLAGDRMTWATGWFNDWIESDYSFSDNGNDFVGRITGLASVSEDNHDYLHLGLGVRQIGDDAQQIRMRGRPESNVTDYYVDTGSFQADAANQLSLELAWSRGPLLLQAEHIETWVDSAGYGDPHFTGSYLGASWMVTGESRPYIRSAGFARQAIPSRPAGAVELVTRYSRLDLDDSAIHGGTLKKWHFGINWWASQQWKIGLSWGDADLDKDGIKGNTKMLLSRLQWFY
jgi:phosphate-selective porin